MKRPSSPVVFPQRKNIPASNSFSTTGVSETALEELKFSNKGQMEVVTQQWHNKNARTTEVEQNSKTQIKQVVYLEVVFFIAVVFKR